MTLNSVNDLPDCFASLQQQSYPDIHITVLDNASSDRSLVWIIENASYDNLIANTENVGFARAHNQILATLPLQAHDYYLPLNPDVKLTPDYIRNLLGGLQKNNAGWGTGKLLLNDNHYIYSVGHALCYDGYAFNIGYGLPDGGAFQDSREVFGASGASPLISTKLIDDVAPDGELFDESMFLYMSDVDLDWRARRRNWRCWYIADAIASHRGSKAAAALRIQAIGNRFLMILKNAYLFDLLIFNVPLIALHCLIRFLLKPQDGKFLINHIIQNLPNVLSKRQEMKIPHRTMCYWFRWACQQPTTTPRSYIERIKHFATNQGNSERG